MTQKDIYVNLELYMMLAAHSIDYSCVKLFDMNIVPLLAKIGENNTNGYFDFYSVHTENITDTVRSIMQYTPQDIDRVVLGKFLTCILELKTNTKIPFSNDDWCVYVFSQDTDKVYHLQKITIHHELIEKAWNFVYFEVGYDTAYVESFLYDIKIE
jgi:hypothetical protein